MHFIIGKFYLNEKRNMAKNNKFKVMAIIATKNQVYFVFELSADWLKTQ